MTADQGARTPPERRVQIAEATWRVIERDGVAGASLRAIAREGGYTTGVLSHHFRNKRELLVHALGLVVDRQCERVARAGSAGDLRTALAELMPLDAGRRRECVIWLALTTASLQDPELAAELARRCAQAREAMRAALGSTVVADPDGTLDDLQALIDGITVNALGQPDRYPPEHQLATLDRTLARLDRTP